MNATYKDLVRASSRYRRACEEKAQARAERNGVIVALVDQGTFQQAEIARLVGVSRMTISKIVTSHKEAPASGNSRGATAQGGPHEQQSSA